MNCGTILHDKNFQFPNERAPCNKLLIILCECGTDHLVLTTTSQAHSKNNKPGCQVADKPPTYFLPQGSDWFDVDTWVELQEVHELPSAILEQKKTDGTITEYRDALPHAVMRNILDCALQSRFIDEYHLDFLRKQRANL